MKKYIIPVMVLIPIIFICMLSSCKKEEEDKCKDIICSDHGYCDIYSGKCKCESGYEGINCDTLMRTKFIGDFSGSTSCIPAEGSDFTIKISGKPRNDINKILMKNIENSITAIGIITGSTTFIVEKQELGGFNYFLSISGEGTINGDTLTFEYRFHGLFNVVKTCTFIGTKQ